MGGGGTELFLVCVGIRGVVPAPDEGGPGWTNELPFRFVVQEFWDWMERAYTDP